MPIDVLAHRPLPQDRLRLPAVGRVCQGHLRQTVRSRSHLRGHHAGDGKHCPGSPCLFSCLCLCLCQRPCPCRGIPRPPQLKSSGES